MESRERESGISFEFSIESFQSRFLAFFGVAGRPAGRAPRFSTFMSGNSSYDCLRDARLSRGFALAETACPP